MGPLPLAVLASAAWARKPAKEDTRPPPDVPAPAVPSGDLDAAVVPQLVGPESVLSLEGLTRNSVNFGFKADTTALVDVDDAAIDAVFAELAADPNWRVTRDVGARVAWRREPESYMVGVDGWHVAAESCSRIGLREGTAVEPAWTSSDRVVRAAAGVGAVQVHGFRPDGGVCAKLAIAFRVEGDLTIEVFEASSSEERPITKHVLGELPYQVANVLAAVQQITDEGFDSLGLPDKEPLLITDPTVVLAAGGPGTIVMRARLNPGEPGWAWLRVVSTDGTVWEEQAVGRATLEAPGWSKDPTHGFYLQATIPAPAGPAFGASAELWFQGRDGGPRRLHAGSLTVPAR